MTSLPGHFCTRRPLGPLSHLDNNLAALVVALHHEPDHNSICTVHSVQCTVPVHLVLVISDIRRTIYCYTQHCNYLFRGDIVCVPQSLQLNPKRSPSETP